MRTRAVILVLAIAASGCCLVQQAKKPAPVPAPVMANPACALPSTPGQIFAGLYSIFHRVAEIELGDLPGFPLPLDEAARFVRCDPDEPARKARTRYAAMKLAAGIVVLRERGAPVARFVDALERLGIPPGVLLGGLAPHHGSTIPDIEDAAGARIDSAGEGSPLEEFARKGCCACIEQCDAGPSDGFAAANFVIGVNRPAKCAFHAVDPKCWPYVAPLNFAQTFDVAGAPACTTYNVPVCQGPPCDQNAAPPGATPGHPVSDRCGLLFEKFTAQYGTVHSVMTNVLGLRTTLFPPNAAPDVATRFRMEFNLCRSVDYDMCQQGVQLPTCSGICPVQLDCGYAQVRQDSQNTNLASLAGSKRIRFASTLPYAVNGWAPIALEVMVKETARAACTAPSTCPGAPTPSCAPAMPEQPCDECPDHCMQRPYVEPDNGASLCP